MLRGLGIFDDVGLFGEKLVVILLEIQYFTLGNIYKYGFIVWTIDDVDEVLLDL